MTASCRTGAHGMTDTDIEKISAACVMFAFASSDLLI